MSETLHQPAYRAAADTAHAELSQIADRLKQLRIRQEQIYTAVEALKLLVSAHEAANSASRSTPATGPVFAMSGRAAQSGEEATRMRALA